MYHRSVALAAPQLVLLPSGVCSWICAARASSPLSAALTCNASPWEHPALLLEATGLEWGTLLSPSPSPEHLSRAIPLLRGQDTELSVGLTCLSVCWGHAVCCSSGHRASLCL